MPKPSGLILVVEDHPQNMMLMSDLLNAAGYQVLQAEDGRQGWELAQEYRPDLIIMDIQLPDVSGLELTKRLKADKELKLIPIIAVTAFAMVGDKEEILEAGCDGYISKPFSVPDVLEIVQRYHCGTVDA